MKCVTKRRIKKDIIKRSNFQKMEIKFNFINFLTTSPINPENRRRLKHKIYKNYKKYSKTNCKNHCIITGRSHSIYSKFKLTRNELKRQILNGYIFGFTKIGW
jgi:ribosomal protein S14